VQGLRWLGVATGDGVLVHSSLRAFGYVAGGAPTVVQALLDVVGPSGTVVVPTFTAGNSDPSRWERTIGAPIPDSWWETVREHLPPFDLAVTPSQNMGAVAETVRTWPGAVRSAHPQTSFAAVGRDARELMRDHPRDCHLGPGTPLARLAQRSARTLLLGVPFGVCSSFHLAEYSRADPPMRDYECVVLDNGRRRWYRYRDVLLDDGDFEQLGRAFECAPEGAVVRRTRIGGALTSLAPIADCASFAETWIAHHRST
jgi:aminoglycoside 3-N-acetyltransferase